MMPAAIPRPGVILRRGADKLTAEQLKSLMDNQAEVDRIVDDINARRDLFLKTEADAKAALDELAAAEKALAEGQDDLRDALADFEPREKEVKRIVKVLKDLAAWFEANPISPIEEH